MKARLRAAQSDVEYYKADRDQLAQELKETQQELKIIDEEKEIQDIECLELEKQVDYLINKIQSTKVARDPKTGRMVSMKSK
jgi:hypothetical protein